MAKNNIKYTKDVLEPLVAGSESVSDVVRKLGLCVKSGSVTHVKNNLVKYGIDFSHFDRFAAARRKNKHVRRKHWSHTLQVVNNGVKVSGTKLRKSLIEAGREYKCVHCGLTDTWNHKSIILEVDHIDSDVMNNTQENLQFLCPNCHSQKPKKYASKITIKQKKEKPCCDCGTLIGYRAKRCKRCSSLFKNKDRVKITWPVDDTLLARLKESNFTQLGLALGVSDNAIRNRLKARHLI